MRLSNFCFPRAVTSLTLLTSLIAAPAFADSGPPPRNGVEGGADTNGTPLYVCYVTQRGDSAQPGKALLYKGKWGCNYGYGGQEYRSESFVYVTPDQGYDYEYAPTDQPQSMGAFRPQVSDSNGSTLYYCTASYGNSTQPGKAIQYRGQWGCNYGYGGREIRVTNDSIGGFNYLWFYQQRRL